MIKWILQVLAGIGLATLFIGATANYQYKDNLAALYNIQLFACGSATCTAMVLENTSGAEIMTTSNPGVVTGSVYANIPATSAFNVTVQNTPSVTISGTPTVTLGTVLATIPTGSFPQTIVTVSNFPATQPVSIATGSMPALDVTVTNFPATQTVTASNLAVSPAGGTTWTVTAGNIAVSPVASPQSILVTNTPTVTMGTVVVTGSTSIQTGSNIVGYVSADPCMQSAKLATPISAAGGSATVQLVGTGASSKQIYVCGIMLVVAVPANVNLIEGTGSFCQTGSGALIGSTVATQGVPVATQGGFVEQGGSMTVAKTVTAADNICVVVSTASQWSGNISYVQQ